MRTRYSATRQKLSEWDPANWGRENSKPRVKISVGSIKPNTHYIWRRVNGPRRRNEWTENESHPNDGETRGSGQSSRGDLGIPCAFTLRSWNCKCRCFFSRLFAPSILAPYVSLHAVLLFSYWVFFEVRILQCFCSRSRFKSKEDFAAVFFHSQVEWMFPGSIIIHISKKLCVYVVCTFLCNGVYVSIKE